MRSYILSCDPSCGPCQFMGTASTMQCMSEALGMALPGSALVPATLQEIHRYARKAGQKIMELAEKGIKSSDILTREAFLNAVKVHAAIGGSTNALLHLPAIAHELNIEISYDDFEKANETVPYLTSIQPSGSFLTEPFWYSGGVPRGIEAAQASKLTGPHRYGSSVHKHLYIYGNLDPSPTILDRSHLGAAYGISGFLMMPYLEKIGVEATRRLQNRVTAELKTTFATSFGREISLADVLRIAEVSRYTKKATGEKVLIAPQKGLRHRG